MLTLRQNQKSVDPEAESKKVLTLKVKMIIKKKDILGEQELILSEDFPEQQQLNLGLQQNEQSNQSIDPEEELEELESNSGVRP